MKTKEPRVLQLIDSFDGGGAERVSINLANALVESKVPSFLCATRRGGVLERFILPEVDLLILHKKSTIDFRAIWKLVTFIRQNDINIIHAHSTSFFTAILCKAFTDVKVIWHDHYGNAEQLRHRQAGMIKKASYFFDYIISVNDKLAQWAKKNLNIESEKIVFIQNFAQLSPLNIVPDLPGTKENRVVCLANLRTQKDHIILLKAFKQIVKQPMDWHLLLVGQEKDDTYNHQLKSYIANHDLEKYVHILGSRSDTADILLHSTIGVLSSESEGLPVALLEYGLAKLPVVCTDVGQCAEVLGYGKFGMVVPAKDSDTLAEAIKSIMDDKGLRISLSKKYHKCVQDNYSKEVVVNQLVEIYEGILNG